MVSVGRNHRDPSFSRDEHMETKSSGFRRALGRGPLW